MLHLDPERLAALADEPPTPEEAAHLATCLACRREREAYVELLALARREGSDAAPPAEVAPLSSWDGIAAALRAEGALPRLGAPSPATDVVPIGAVRRRELHLWSPRLRQAAAAALLIAGGMAAGRATVGAPALPLGTAAMTAPATTAAVVPAAGPAVAPAFGSVEEATARLVAAQRDYQLAAAFLAEHDSTGAVASDGGSDVLRARLAALDEVVPRVREALGESPLDPVLNQVYMTTYDVRQSTLRQLGRTLPTGARLTGY